MYQPLHEQGPFTSSFHLLGHSAVSSPADKEIADKQHQLFLYLYKKTPLMSILGCDYA